MRLKIKNIVAANVSLDSASNLLQAELEGVQLNDLLNSIDIQDIINYYGITELLDVIGEKNIKVHLKDLNKAEMQSI